MEEKNLKMNGGGRTKFSKTAGISVLQKLKTEKTKTIIKKAIIFFVVLICWIAVLQIFTAEKYKAVVKVAAGGVEESVNPNAVGLDYGSLSGGSSSTRFITVANRGSHKVYIKILKVGNIASLIKVNRNDFVLQPDKSEEMDFSIEVPKDSKKAGYSGTIIIFKIPEIF